MIASCCIYSFNGNLWLACTDAITLLLWVVCVWWSTILLPFAQALGFFFSYLPFEIYIFNLQLFSFLIYNCKQLKRKLFLKFPSTKNNFFFCLMNTGKIEKEMSNEYRMENARSIFNKRNKNGDSFLYLFFRYRF